MRKPQKPYIAISLGFGVQSTCLAFMSALGELPSVDVAVFSDTQHESQFTYEYATKWIPFLTEHGVNVQTVVSHLRGGTEIIYNNNVIPMPLYTIDENGRKGRMSRQCTENWKIEPLKKYVRSHKNLRQKVELWIGISEDEKHRAKESKLDYIKNRYPLLELGMTRQDCVDWFVKHNIEVPPKSSCVFCPFHSREYWRNAKRENNADYKTAVEVDELLRNKSAKMGSLYLHADRIPIADVIEDKNNDHIDRLMEEVSDCNSGYCFI